MKSRSLMVGFGLSLTLAVLASPGVRTMGAGYQQPSQSRGASQQGQSQAAALGTASTAPMTSVVVTPEESYAIGPSDVIEIEVLRAPELSTTYRVDSDGTIMVPYIGSIEAAGKTARQLARAIATGLRGDYLVNPQVAVSVLQVNSRTFFIQGAVQRPGAYQIAGQPTLLELITVAGGLSTAFGSTAFIIRRIKPKTSESGTVRSNPVALEDRPRIAAHDTEQIEPGASAESGSQEEPKFELVKVNINGLLRGNFQENVLIEPGDMIHIPPTDVFFVSGEVRAPGQFPLKEGTTLRQAISLAQGTTFEAATARSVIFRENLNTGKREELHVDVKQVMSGKSEDVALRANDIVIVPNSRFKSIGSTLIKAFGVSAAHAPVY
jgi:polysaccharide export outer membrane protein